MKPAGDLFGVARQTERLQPLCCAGVDLNGRTGQAERLGDKLLQRGIGLALVGDGAHAHRKVAAPVGACLDSADLVASRTRRQPHEQFDAVLDRPEERCRQFVR